MIKGEKIGIIGGTFDPIHNGHLVIASCAADAYGLDQVIFIPSAIPPHKMGKKITPVEQRYEMTLLATLDNHLFSVSKVEMERSGSSYTIDTIKHFREELPDSEIYFITGADTIVEIDSWKNPEDLMQMVYFIAAVRPGYTFEGLAKDFYQRNRERIFLLETPKMDISSTEIRRRVQEGKTIQYLVHPSVQRYIDKFHLYD